MKRFSLSLSLVIFTLLLYSQNRPVIFPEDVSPNEYNLRCLCKPGVWNKSRSKGLEIGYDLLLGTRTLKEEQGTIVPPNSTIRKLENFYAEVKIPVLLKEDTKLFVGYDYNPEQYHFNTIGPSFDDVFRRLDDRLMKSNAFSIYFTRSLNEKNYLAFRARAQFNGDYEGWLSLNSDYAIYNGIGLLGFKIHDDLEWGVGVTFSTGFRQTTLLPFVMYNRNFSANFGLESVLPAYISLRYNFSRETILLAGPQYRSRSYAVHLDDNFDVPPVYELNHSEIRFNLRLEQKIVSWLWVNVESGYQVNFSTDFNNGNELLPPFEVELENGFFLNMGIFLSPPDSLY